HTGILSNVSAALPKYDFFSRAKEAVGNAVNKTIGSLEDLSGARWSNDTRASAERTKQRNELTAKIATLKSKPNITTKDKIQIVKYQQEHDDIGVGSLLTSHAFDKYIGEQYPDSENATAGKSYYTKLAEDGHTRGKYGLKGAGKVTYDIAENVADMASDIGAASLMGVHPVSMTALTSAGKGFTNAKNDGKTENEALTYGVLSGIKEGALQYALGGISAIGKNGVSKIVSKISQKIPMNKSSATTLSNTVNSAFNKIIKNPKANVALRTIGKQFAHSTDEAIEEYLQETLEPVIRNVAFDEDNKINLTSGDALYSAVLGFITSGVINSTDIKTDYSNAKKDFAQSKLSDFVNDKATNSMLKSTNDTATVQQPNKAYSDHALDPIAQEIIKANSNGANVFDSSNVAITDSETIKQSTDASQMAEFLVKTPNEKILLFELSIKGAQKLNS
ncbi:MAG: hypothetical protein RR261_07065, partial [Oscillospiraceae bacterium]